MGFSLSQRYLRAGLGGILRSGKLLERIPTRVAHSSRSEFGVFFQFVPGLGVQPGTIRPAHRLERQCKHYRVSDDGFKIHVIILNVILTSFVPMIREKLLKLDFNAEGDVIEASSALSACLGYRLSGDQNTLVNRLETQVEFEWFVLAHGNQAFTPLHRSGHVNAEFLHLAGLADEVSNEEIQRITHPVIVWA